jgi:hypothetical protein
LDNFPVMAISMYSPASIVFILYITSVRLRFA